MTTAEAFSDAELAAYYPSLIQWARRRFSPADAEEVVQEALLRAHRYRNQFQPGTSLGAWLQRIMMNVARDRWRAEKTAENARATRTEYGTVFSPQIQQANQEHIAGNMELVDALEQLTPAHRELLVLYYMYDLSCAEIAEVLNVALGTVLSRLHRARQALTELLEP